jgi:hypothetical protein
MANAKGQYMIDGNASNSSHHEQVQAITVLRSGRVVDNQVEEKRSKQTGPPKKPHLANDKGVSNEVPSLATPTLETPYEPKAPFPEHLKEPSHFGKQLEKIKDMMKVFKQVKIKIPLLDAILKIPSYAKFHKHLCIQQCRFRNHIPKKVLLREQVSSLI